MKSASALLIIGFFLIVSACSQSGGLNKNSKSGIDTSEFSSSSNSSSTSANTAVSGIAMRYQYPEIPTTGKDLQYYVTGFADINVGTLKPKEDQVKLSGQVPAQQLKIELKDNANGSEYCFSNDQYEGGPLCRNADGTLVNHIKSMQATPTGLHPVFISALKFHFRNAAKSAGGNYTEPHWESAYVEKSPIVFVKNSGKLTAVIDSSASASNEVMRLSYGTNDCNIADQNAVGFNPPSYLPDEYYLSGVWSFERAGRQIFGNEVVNVPQEAKVCTTQGVGDYFCNLFADKVDVWHALLVPVLYTTGNVTHRQDPADAIVNSKLVRNPSAAKVTFGKYANSDINEIVTPEFGKVDANGNEVPNWQNYFIRKFCIKGYRLEHSVAGEQKVPLIQAMRFELRSPFIKKVK